MTVDVFADIACPFCYIGERHFEEALREARAASGSVPEEVAWRWRPFQLQPGLPKQGVPWRAFAEKKFGSWERAQASFGHVREMGTAAGLDFRFDRLAAAVNTADAHRLVLWAAGQGRAQEMARALFAAYFTEGRDIGHAGELAALAEEAGLNEEDARALLASARLEAEVEESQQEARRLGVTGVPLYVFRDGAANGGEGSGGAGNANMGNARALSGAQPVAAFRQALAGG